ncbi:hypothetical protein [Cellulomonas fimi]|uniref:hypothetical protein n=1 Tax=Cellulomonas fimi TaxID=1708 RepID=UPI001B87B68C|nr:hypothetical protein [Cellulomonas fimi]
MAPLRRPRSGQHVDPAPPPTTDVTHPHPGRTPLVDAVLDKAVTIPSSKIHEHVQSLRRRNPYASPAQIIALLEREYMLVIQGAGGAVGAAAAAPAVGTGVATVLTAGDVAAFFASSAAFALGVASVHGIEVEDAGRRRALLLTTVLGESGLTGDAAEITSGAFARTLLTRMPTSTIKRVNRTLTKRLIRRQAMKQGALAFGRLAPFGIGAFIGVTGARALGKTVIEGARKAFGPPPQRFPQLVEVVETGAAPRVIPSSSGPVGPDWQGGPGPTTNGHPH